MRKLYYQSALFMALLAFSISSSACNGGSVVSDSSSKPSQSPVIPSTAQPAASPAAGNAAAQQIPQQAQQATASPSPSSTMLPAIKAAQAQPGVPVTVPESMKRPLNAQEMQKALQAMPPEVRARIQGMQAAPPGVAPGAKPQATPKP